MLPVPWPGISPGMLLRSITLVLGVVLGVAAPAHADREVLDRIAAIVNDEVVLVSEVNRAMRASPLYQEAMSQLPPSASPQVVEQKQAEVRAKVLDELIDGALIRAEAARFQITATDEDVERALPNVASSNGLSVAELRQQVEASPEYGSWDEYREELRRDILVYKTMISLATWNVTEAQVRERYRKVSRDEGARVVVERMLFAPQGQGSKARDKAFARAQIAARRLRASEPAERVAADIGYTDELQVTIARGDIAPVLEDAVFAAKANQVVGPLASGQGYAVFKVVEHRESSALSYEEAKQRIRAQLEEEAFVKAQNDFKTGLRAKSHVDIRL